MKSLKDNLFHNNYPESIPISTTRNLDQIIESNTQKLTTVCLLIINSLAKKIQKICIPYDIRTIFRSGTTLLKYLF